MPLDVKIFNLEFLGCSNLQIEDFNILGHDPRMLKASNRRFGDPKISDVKILTSWAMSLDAKSFVLDVFGSPNLQIDDFKILGPCPWLLKCIPKPPI